MKGKKSKYNKTKQSKMYIKERVLNDWNYSCRLLTSWSKSRLFKRSALLSGGHVLVQSIKLCTELSTLAKDLSGERSPLCEQTGSVAQVQLFFFKNYYLLN